MRIAGIDILRPLDMRRAARALYPKALARKWLHAWRLAPAPRVAVGKLTDAEHLERGRLRALFYLRFKSRVGYAMDLRRPPVVVARKEEAPPPKAHRIRRVK